MTHSSIKAGPLRFRGRREYGSRKKLLATTLVLI